MADATPTAAKGGTFAPLRSQVFRRIWIASLFANFGVLIQGVGAAWAMTEMTDQADLVALVQTATFAPMMLGAILAGAVADTYDRRKVAIIAQGICMAGALGLTLITFFGGLTPWLLLSFCFIVGSGTALYGPSWQSSVSEQVPPSDLPAAIGLNSISYNVARSFGPAIGGVLVAITGPISAFIVNFLGYIPLVLAMFFWRRTPEKSRLPPEGLTRAMISGVRYVFHSPTIRTTWLRALIFTFCGSSASALMPLIARDLLGGGASTYGMMLGSFGVGAVTGAICMSRVRAAISTQKAENLCAVIMGTMAILVGFSGWALLTALLLFVMGGCWMIGVALFNITTQVSAPRWVGGRALASFQVAVTGGIALGGWAWGHVALISDIRTALMASGAALIVTLLPALVLRLKEPENLDGDAKSPPDFAVGLNLVGRSGPIVIMIEYRVPAAQARDFYKVMQEVQLSRQRSGAYGWSISRDISDPEIWTERYHTPTWHDYLRQRTRLTPKDRDATERAQAFHIGDEPPRLRRKLERPFGSVRWTEDTPDTGIGDVSVPVSVSQSGG